MADLNLSRRRPSPREGHRYQRRYPPGRTFSVHVQQDVIQALAAYSRTHGLTRSGAAHHLLRQALGLPPLEP